MSLPPTPVYDRCKPCIYTGVGKSATHHAPQPPVQSAFLICDRSCLVLTLVRDRAGVEYKLVGRGQQVRLLLHTGLHQRQLPGPNVSSLLTAVPSLLTAVSSLLTAVFSLLTAVSSLLTENLVLQFMPGGIHVLEVSCQHPSNKLVK